MKNLIIEAAINEYFHHMSTVQRYKLALLGKELNKLAISDWILCATSPNNIGFANMLKSAAQHENVYLNKSSEVKPGDTIYISISSANRGLTNQAFDLLKDQVIRLLDMGSSIVMDNKYNANRSYNAASEGELYTYLTNTKKYDVCETDTRAVWKTKSVKYIITTGPGSSLEYEAYMDPFTRKYCTKTPIIRATNKKIKFINFSGIDINLINEVLKGRLKDTSGGAYYVPDASKYTKTTDSLIKLVEYLKSKGVKL